MCYCCGKEGHKVPECDQKDKIPRDKWFICKMQQHYIGSVKEENDGDSDNSSIESETTSQRSTRSSQSGKSKAAWSGLHVSMVHRSANLDEMKKYIILDTGSTMTLFANPNLVEDIKTTNKTLLLATNAGMKENNKQANVPGFGGVWYDPNAIVNIFGFAEMVDKHQITSDSDKEDAPSTYTRWCYQV